MITEKNESIKEKVLSVFTPFWNEIKNATLPIQIWMAISFLISLSVVPGTTIVVLIGMIAALYAQEHFFKD